MRTRSRRFLVLTVIVAAVLVATGLILVGCNDDNNPTTVDTTAPGPVTNLTATAQPDAVHLIWANPGDPDFNGVQVRRDTLTTPTDSTGTLLFTGMTSEYTDDTITPGQSYIYAVFAYDAVGNIAPPAVASVGTNAPVPVAFADPDLADAVRSALGLPPGDILATDMLALTELDISGKDIDNITGLEYALNLGKLVMNSPQLDPPSGMEILSTLTNLWELEIRYHNLTSLPDLTGLPLLRNLYLQGDQINSLQQFAGMPALIQFSVSGSGLSDLSPLAGITTLGSVQFFDSALEDLSPLAGLPHLTSLGVFVAPLSDISPLATMTQLQSVHFVDTDISDLAPLANMTDLRSVHIYNNPHLHDMQPLVDNTSFDAGSTLSDGNTPWLHEAVAVQAPALEARGVQVNLGTGLPTDLVGIWEPRSASVNGVNQDLPTFFDWDPGTVASRVTFYYNNTYEVHDLDASGGDTYAETGSVTEAGGQVTMTELTENGVEVPDGDVMTMTWSVTGDQLTATQDDGVDVAVIVFARLPE